MVRELRVVAVSASRIAGILEALPFLSIEARVELGLAGAHHATCRDLVLVGIDLEVGRIRRVNIRLGDDVGVDLNLDLWAFRFQLIRREYRIHLSGLLRDNNTAEAEESGNDADDDKQGDVLIVDVERRLDRQN